MKELYISDLDGTLLNKNAELSKYTINTLNELLAKGMNFSIATARTSATALHIMNQVKLKLPIILMNGVLIYDMNKNVYLNKEVIDQASAFRMLELLKRHNQTGFLYTLHEEELITYYENLDSYHRKKFHDERVGKYRKVFIKVNDFTECLESEIIYFSTSDRIERIQPVYEELKKDESLHVEFYRDIYQKNYWYLEICSSGASKANAVDIIKESFGFDRVVSFGDNLNDLSMFAHSNECYAVGNAKEEVKKSATDVIRSNQENGVADFLKKRFEESENESVITKNS